MRYIVYSNGRVFNRETETWLNDNPLKQRAKYLTVRLKNNSNNLVTMGLHRLIWETFNGEIPHDMQINHKDEDTHNNNISNMELVTPS